jgi:hypothetical protein
MKYLFFLFFFPNISSAQITLLHSVSGEIGGQAIIYGVDYDLRFKTDSIVNLGVGAVGSVFFGSYYGHSAAALRGFCTIGKKKSVFETGLGIVSDDESGGISGGLHPMTSYRILSNYIQGYFGYRYQPLDGGLLLRVYTAPLSFKVSGGKTEFGLTPLGIIGVSLGYTFKPKTAK